MACHSILIPGTDQTATAFFEKSQNAPVDYFQAATEANGADKFSEFLDSILENDGGSQKKRRKRNLENITLSHLKPYFDEPLETAAKKFGVGVSTFRYRCRELGMSEWPYKKRNVSTICDQLGELEHYFMDIDTYPEMDYEATGNPDLEKFMKEINLMILEKDGGSQKKSRKRKLENITLSHLEPYFDEPLETAAKRFEVSVSTLGYRCRELGLSGWPYKKGNASSVRDQLREIERFLMDDIDACPEMDYEAAGNHPALDSSGEDHAGV